VNGALFELLWRSFRGALVRRARRLRRPRYLIAFLVSAAYFGFLVLPSVFNWTRHTATAGGGGAAGEGIPADAARLASLVAAAAMAFAVTMAWLLASSKPALSLGEADIELLLPAPLPRRKLIELALWRQQAGLLFGALVLTLFRGHGPPSVRLGRLYLAWSLLTLISLHAKGVSLWKARLREVPRAAAGRRVGLAIALAAGYWGALAMAVHEAWVHAVGASAGAATAGAATASDWRQILHRLASSPPPVLTVLLAPFHWLTAAFLPGAGVPAAALPGAGAAGWPATALLLAILVAAHYEWVVRSRARFEDAVVERARRQLERRSRRSALPAPTAQMRRREPFPLAPTGPPELAIYWKNLLIHSRLPLARRAAGVALPGLAAWAAGAALGAPLPYVASAAGAGLMLMVLLPPFAGLVLRHDLRMDLPQFEVLRPWPVAGWRLVAAELLAPATTALAWTLTGCGVVLGAALAAGTRLTRSDVFHLAARPEHWQAAAGGAAAHATPAGSGVLAAAAAICAALLIAGIPVTLLSAAVQNLAALVLPGWVALGPERRGASGLAGQRLLVLLGQLVALAVGLLPAGLAVAAALLAGRALGLPLAPWEAPLLALVGSLPVLAEVALLVRIGGAFWDRLDPSEEILNPAE
jgi:ABC-2 type transport system permease protein